MSPLSHADSADVLADALWQAEHGGQPCEPLRHAAERLGWPATEENAYAVQRLVRARRCAAGDRIVGRKIGLTAPSVQQQLGVFHPDYGCLWHSTEYADGATVPFAGHNRPKIEAEVAIVLGRDLQDPQLSLAELLAATAYALPALEIVDTRVRDWDIRLFDTVADNASAAGFVLGADPRRLDQLTLREARMRLARGDEEVSRGAGRDCLGHPLNAALWLARQAARYGEPLKAGDIVLTGALGPMVAIAQGDRFEAEIEGLGKVAVAFS
jgi:2-keto-4-pentenoate hydratase